jgi:hypothetical protein
MVNSGGSTMSYINMSNPSAGMMRYNGSNQNIEVYDGNIWQMMSGGTATIETSFAANEIFAWAQKRMAEEKEWEKLAETNNAVKLALENMNQARQQLDITAKLVKDHNETTN